MNISVTRKFQFGHCPNTFEDVKGDIKLWNKTLVVVFFEKGLLISMQMEEHMISFFRMSFETMFIILLIHPLLNH
jgi:hypothetical protein